MKLTNKDNKAEENDGVNTTPKMLYSHIPLSLTKYMCHYIIKPWWHHQMETFSALLALCEGNPLVTRALMYSLILAWINDWANNWDTGDLLCHHARYDDTVMHKFSILMPEQNGHHFAANIFQCIEWKLSKFIQIFLYCVSWSLRN